MFDYNFLLDLRIGIGMDWNYKMIIFIIGIILNIIQGISIKNIKYAELQSFLIPFQAYFNKEWEYIMKINILVFFNFTFVDLII